MKTLIEKIRKTIIGTDFENKTYIAGGFVRDMLMNKDSNDIDIVVELENGGVRLAEFLSKELNGTSVVIFERFGTAKIVIDGLDIEFVMSRKENYKENDRKCEVSYGTIEDDVRRRDFTINSLLYDISNSKIIDILDGSSDIINCIIRTTSEPDIIFNEDPLRMLRAIRFSSRLNFTIEVSTFESIKRNSNLINNISNERIREEFMKILSNDNYEYAIKLLIETNLMDNIGLPELATCIGIEQNKYHKHDVYSHIMEVMDNSINKPLHRLAALLHDIGKPEKKTKDDNGIIHFYEHELKSADIALRFMNKLKFSSDEINIVVSSVKNHMKFCQNLSNKTIRKMRRELGDKTFLFCTEVAKADRLSHVDFDITLFERVNDIMNETLINERNVPINGKILMEKFGLKPSKLVGELLNYEISLLEEFPYLNESELLIKIETFYKSKL